MPRNTRVRYKKSPYVRLYSTATAGEGGQGSPLVIRAITMPHAIKLVASGKAACYYEDGEFQGLRMRESLQGESSSACMLTADTASVAAGAGLKKPHEVSDRCYRRKEEAQAAKLLVWPSIYDRRAVLAGRGLSSD